MTNKPVLAALILLWFAEGVWGQSPAPVANFRSMLQSETAAESPDGLGLRGNSLPPDTTGAAGLNHIMTAANFTVRITDKAGGNARTFGLGAWWNALRGAATTPALAPFDPVVCYDPFEHRWIFGCSVFKVGGSSVDCEPPTYPSRFVLAVSRTSDPLGEWYYYEFRANQAAWRYPTGVWFDQPTVGFNRHYIGIAVTVPCLGNDAVMILDKAQAYAGRTRFWLLTSQPPRPGTADTSYQWFGGNSVCRTYDNTENKLYLLRHHDATLARYGLSSIEPGPTAGTLAVRANYVYPEAAGWGHSMSGTTTGNLMPQADSEFGINPMGEGIRTSLYRNGSIWAAHAAYLGAFPRTARTEAQWFQLSPVGTFQQIGRIGGLFFGWVASPAIAVNAAGDALVGYSRCDAVSFLSAAYAFRAATDAPGTMRRGTTYQAGLGTILHWDGPAGMSRNRSGDYSAACPDPDNTTLWAAQEFAGTMNRWGIQWAAVQRPGAGAPAITGSTTVRGTVAVPMEYFIRTTPLATAFRAMGPLPAGLTLDAATGRISGTPTGHGRSTVDIVVSNPSGGNTGTFFFDISASDLADAIDIDRTVRTVEASSWLRQTTNTHDGEDAARSGIISHNGSTWMEMLVLAPASVSFWWKVSSEGDHDFLSVYTNNVLHSSISGDVPWQEVTLDIPGTTFTSVRWEYRKDGSISSRQDAGYVDGVVLSDSVPTRLYIPENLGAIINQPFFIIPLPDPPPDARVRFGYRGPIPAGMVFDEKTGTLSGTIQQPGTYGFEIIAISPWGTFTKPVTLTMSGISHNAALNDASGIYRGGGAMPWTTSDDTAASHDKISASRSGGLLAGQESWIEREVKGPALLSFWWAMSGSLSDTYTVQLDGKDEGALRGVVPYRRHTIDIPAGDHVIRWTFKKAEAVNIAQAPGENPAPELGQGLAWLDEVIVGPPQVPVLSQLITFRLAISLPIVRQIEASNDPSSYSLNGTLPQGLQFDPATGQISGTPMQAGTFQMSVSAANSAGSSFATLIIVVDDRGLGAGLGIADSVPESGGNVPWSLDPLTEFNGGPSARSGKIDHSGSSWMQLSVDGPADLSFYWKVSSEPNADILRLIIDGLENDRISGESDWAEKIVQLGPGSHVVRWEYFKNQSGSAGADAAWVANLSSHSVLLPGFVGPRAWAGKKGELFGQKVQAVNADELKFIGSPPAGLTFDSKTGLISGTPQSTGTFIITIEASNIAGIVQDAFHLVIDGPAIAQGVELDAEWETDPARPWFVQSENSHDNQDAVQSAAIGDSESTWLRGKFQGPGTVTFWIATSSERKHDALSIYLDGEVKETFSGERAWMPLSLTIPPGTHQVEWQYEKDSVGFGGCDSVWLDQIVFKPADPLPTITVASPVIAVAGSPFTLSATSNVPVESWAAEGLPLGIGIDVMSGQISGQVELRGDYNVSVTAANASGVASKPLFIRVISPFQDWAAGNGLLGADAEPEADPDGDGISNMAEYVLGMDPTKEESMRFDVSRDSDAFHISFLRDASAKGFTLEAETSTDLQLWEAAAKAGDHAPMQALQEDITVSETPLQGTMRRVTLKVPSAGKPALFARVIVRY